MIESSERDEIENWKEKKKLFGKEHEWNEPASDTLVNGRVGIEAKRTTERCGGKANDSPAGSRWSGQRSAREKRRKKEKQLYCMHA